MILNKLLKHLIAFGGLFLGFSYQVIAQYGIMPRFHQKEVEINGILLSTPCNEPIKNIKISDRWNRPLGFTNEKGEFKLKANVYEEWDGKMNVNPSILGFTDTSGMKIFSDTSHNLIPGENGKASTYFMTYTTTPSCIKEEMIAEEKFLKKKRFRKRNAKATSADSTITEIIAINSTAEVSSEISILNKPSIYIFPNPGHDIFNIKSSGINGEFMLSILDSRGALVFSKSIIVAKNEETISLDFSFLSPGMYYAELRNKGISLIGKFIKK
jgi:hypothetical protein